MPHCPDHCVEREDCAASRASCRRPSSRSRWPHRAPCRAGRCATCGRRPIRAPHRCGARSPRSAAPLPAAVHCSICWSPSELPNAKIGRRPMKRLMLAGLPGPSSTNSTLSASISTGLPSGSVLNSSHAGRADHLLGRNAVDLLGQGAHELDAAARHDEGLEAVGAQVLQQLEHRLIDEIGIGPVEARVPRARDPARDRLREFVGRHAGMRGRDDLEQALLAGRRQRLQVVFEHRLERLLRLPLGMLAARAP